MSDAPVTLEFLARQQAQLLDDMAAFRAAVATLIETSSRIELDLNALLRDAHGE